MNEENEILSQDGPEDTTQDLPELPSPDKAPKKRNLLGKVLSYCFAGLVGAGICCLLFLHFGVADPVIYESTQGLPEVQKLQELNALIDERFIGDYDNVEICDAAAAAMIGATGDRWSYYVPAEQYDFYTQQSQNAYVGVGITIQLQEDPQGLLVKQVTPGGGADEVGILAGDVLIEANGQNCYEMGLEETRTVVLGEEGTTVHLALLRDGQRLEFDVERRTIEVPVVKSRMLDAGYGYIQIVNFEGRSSQDTIAAIDELTAQGAKGFIFDVRYNPGGYQHELVKILDYILPDDQLLFTSEFYTGEVIEDYSEDGHQMDLPIVVLMNGDSYSAAEFFAAALSEYDYAELIGEPTTGKGYFQTTIRLSDGSAAALSVGKYFTPKGVSLAGLGLQPDRLVEVDEELYNEIFMGTVEEKDDPQLMEAISALNAQVSP